MPDKATLDHLAALYAADPDPWQHATRPYERAKHAQTMAAIGSGPYVSGVEIGCGNGPLTDQLAAICRDLIAMDCIPAALDAARSRVRSANVTFVHAVVPDRLPPGSHDLVVLSEVLYFLEAADIVDVAIWIDARAAPNCRVVCVNWSGSTGHTLSGRVAADCLVGSLSHWYSVRHCHDGYTIDILSAPAAP